MAEYNNQSGKQDKKKYQEIVPEKSVQETVLKKQSQKIVIKEEQETAPIEQDPHIIEANKKLKDSADYFLQTSLTKFKRKKKKKKKKKEDRKKKYNVNLSHLDVSPEFSSEIFEKIKNGSIPESQIPFIESHCWTIEKVMVNGVWMVPQHKWACKDIQGSVPDTLAGLTANYSLNLPPYGPPIGPFPGPPWPSSIPNTFPSNEQFSMQGPFIVASLCPPLGWIQNPTGFAPGTPGWLDYLRAGPTGSYGQIGGNGPLFHYAHYRSACGSFFYDWVMQAMNNNTPPYTLAPVVGDYVTIVENGPSYINANTIDIYLPSDPVEAFCLKYQGRHSEWPEYTLVNPTPHGADDIVTPEVESYVEPFMYGDPDHNVEFISCGQTPCEQRITQYHPNPCGEVGSINPHTGGVVFKTNQGPSGMIWYEAAPTDVTEGIDIATGNTVSITPGGTVDPVIGTNECFQGYDEEITLHHTTSLGYQTYSGGVTTNVVSGGPQWTNILANWDVLATQGWFAIGIGPNSDNPQITSANYTDHIDIGTTKMYHYDQQGSPCFMYEFTSVPWASIQCVTPAINTVTDIVLVPANSPVGGGAPNNMVISLGNHDFDLLLVRGKPDHWLWTYDSSNVCPGHGLVTPNPTTPGSCPTCNVPAWKTKFVKTTPGTGGVPLGRPLEWGVFNLANTQPTLAGFSGLTSPDSVGFENSLIIDSYVNNPALPYHPTQDLGFVAAEETLLYNSPGYPPLPLGPPGWFLPSLDEFMIMIDGVGPGALATWANPANQTQAHIDFQNSFYNHSNGVSENIYWTSSEDDANSLLNISSTSSYTGNNADNYAIAVRLSGGGYNPTPMFTSRCHGLTARPIRTYKCPSPPIPEYNFRDSHGIWLDGDAANGTMGGGEQALTPFVSVYTPGQSGSSQSGMDDPNPSNNPGHGGVIGMTFFNWSLATTDVMGNDFKQLVTNPANPHEWRDAFTNRNPANHPTDPGGPNGHNPDGFIISIWDNQKRFIGKWHYAEGTRCVAPNCTDWGNHGVRQNQLDWHGYVTDCSYPALDNPWPGINCNGTPTYTTYREEFPDLVALTFSYPTFLEGGYYGNRPVFRYGQNREAHMRGWMAGAAPPIGAIFNGDYHHPYLENVFNGWDASYAYIKIECQATQNIGANAYNILDDVEDDYGNVIATAGPNTDIDGGQVVCMRNLFKDTYQSFSPPNPNLNPTTGSILGCGDISNHQGNSAPFPNGYGWQWGNSLLKGNSAFGDLYGINYTDGRRQQPLYVPTGQAGAPMLALHPKHWAFIWFGAQKPMSGGINWYNDLHEGYEHCYGFRCKWDLGDIGPAGGIIVGVPGMLGNEVVPGGASSNNSEWYYEMSAEDLGEPVTPTNPIEFGALNTWNAYPNLPVSCDDSNTSWVPIWNSGVGPHSWIGKKDNTGGNINQGFHYGTPTSSAYHVTGSGIGETSTELYGDPILGFLHGNPVGGPHSVPSAQNAHILCKEYETQDQFGNVYDDWYLPSIEESWYIINNAPLGTFASSSDVSIAWDLYWTSNRYDTEPGNQVWSTGIELTGWLGWEVLRYNTMYDHGGTFVKGVPQGGFDKTNAAYAYNVAKKIRKQGPVIGLPPGIGGGPPPPVSSQWPQNWQPLDPSTDAAYVVRKDTNLKVRAIRRFKCPPPPGPWEPQWPPH